jgi:hypothetical protein
MYSHIKTIYRIKFAFGGPLKADTNLFYKHIFWVETWKQIKEETKKEEKKNIFIKGNRNIDNRMER